MDLHPHLDYLEAILVLFVTGVGFGAFTWSRLQDRERELEVARQDNRAIAARLADKEALRESHERCQALANATFEGLLIHDGGIVLDANEACLALLGVKREDLIGKSFFTFLSEEFRAVVRRNQEIPLTAPDHVIGPYELDVRNAVGELLHVEVRIKALPYQGRMVRVAAFQDVTDRHRLERAKSELVSVVSHELRTPLGSLHNSLEVLAHGAAGELPARARRMVDLALKSADRLIRITNQTLEYDQLSRGQYSLNLTDCEAADLLQQAAETMRGLAESRGIHLRVEAESCRLTADEDRINQVLVNLLSNALAFAPSGSVVRMTAQRSKDEIRFEVRDQGPGIPADRREAVFERFVQLDNPARTGHRGIGLGLAICRDLIELHGGRIGVDSVLGEGSTFHFSLPLNAKGAPV